MGTLEHCCFNVYRLYFILRIAVASKSVMAVGLLLSCVVPVFQTITHFALLFAASISLRVASSRSAVSTAPDGK